MTPLEKIKMYRNGMRYVLTMLDLEAEQEKMNGNLEIREFVNRFIEKLED